MWYCAVENGRVDAVAGEIEPLRPLERMPCRYENIVDGVGSAEEKVVDEPRSLGGWLWRGGVGSHHVSYASYRDAVLLWTTVVGRQDSAHV